MQAIFKSISHLALNIIAYLLMPITLWGITTTVIFKIVWVISPPFMAQHGNKGLASLISIGFRFVPSMLCAIPISAVIIVKLFKILSHQHIPI